MSESGESLDRIRRLPVDAVNTGPKTEAWIRYEKRVIAFALVRELLSSPGIEGAVMQHSSDLIMLYRDRRPKLVSIKHRDPHQSSGDSGWQRSQLKEPLTELHKWWLQAERAAQPAFWSNGGFVGPARKDHSSLIAGTGPTTAFIEWFVKGRSISKTDARQYLQDLELLAEPLPRLNEIASLGADATADLLRELGRSSTRLYAPECFDALSTRIIELSDASPVPPLDDSRMELVRELYPQLNLDDAAALAERLLPVAEAKRIVLSEHDRRVTGALPSIGFQWEPDDRFVGRADTLSELATLLDPGGVQPVAPVALSGMPGCGKTSIAAQFAAVYSDVLHPIFVNADSRAEVIAALQQLTDGSEGRTQVGIENARTVVTPVLPATSRTLLILDGVVDPDTVRGLIPRRSMCRVLITTTVVSLDIGYKELKVRQWQREESQTFLEGHLLHEAPEELDRLRRDLHDHPLALNQAVDYCRVVELSVSDYLMRLRSSPTEILERGRAAGHPESTVKSIRMGIEAVEALEPDSMNLLAVLSLLGPGAIAESRFDSPLIGATQPPPATREQGTCRPGVRWFLDRFKRPEHEDIDEPITTPEAQEIRKKLSNQAERSRAIEALARMSLIRARGGELSVHPLIALVVKSRLTNLRPWLEICVGIFFPERDLPNLDSPVELGDELSAAAHVTATAFENGFTGAATLALTTALVKRLTLVGATESATPHGWNAIDFAERGIQAAVQNSEITRNLSWQLIASNLRISLMYAHSTEGNVDDAFDQAKENIWIGSRIGRRIVVDTVINAEVVASIHGRREEAEGILNWIESLSAGDLDPPSRAGMLIARANILRLMNRTDDAINSINHAIEIIEPRRGELPPSYAMKAYGAAALLSRDRGDAQQALKYELAVLDAQRESGGTDNVGPAVRIQHILSGSDAAMTAHRLPLARTMLEEAEKFAVKDCIDHKSVVYADLLTIRGRLLHLERELDKSRADLERAIEIFHSMPSGFRPRLPAPLFNLALVLGEQGHAKEAIARATEAYTIDCEVYGPEHEESIRDQALLMTLTASAESQVAGGPEISNPADQEWLDFAGIMRNLRGTMEIMCTHPEVEWRIFDIASESSMSMLFDKLGLGRDIICTTLDLTRDILTRHFGESALISRHISQSFDLNQATGLQVSYTDEEHALARQLLNGSLTDNIEFDSNSAVFDGIEDPWFLLNTWCVLLIMYGFVCASLRALHDSV
ncbi:tetratricopeptide repeat protein [Nocardia carnea]|uniref:tetratricopeptide repeat protein n=1 Tax=Nocardia carnea TaxID=37328 RepID=UPI0024586D19|nr:NB-ARC domain-containing protein [Nocardia carnea]